MNDISAQVPAETLQQHFKGHNKELVRILASLLEINPYFRPSIAEVLKDPIFDQIRVNALEKPAQSKFVLEVDQFN